VTDAAPLPPGELAGLRAHEVRVGAHAGQRYPERPQWVDVGGARAEVTAIESEWREEERLGWLVRLADARRVLLYYVPQEDLWSGVVLA
jgi:hypothetical protein